MERVESCHSVWLFDTERMRFRRMARGGPLDVPALESDWEPYYGLELSADSDAFAVILNESGTRLIRSWRHTEPCGHCAPAVEIDVTGEVSLAPSE